MLQRRRWMSLMVFARDNTRDTRKTTRFKRGGEGAVKFDGDLLNVQHVHTCNIDLNHTSIGALPCEIRIYSSAAALIYVTLLACLLRLPAVMIFFFVVSFKSCDNCSVDCKRRWRSERAAAGHTPTYCRDDGCSCRRVCYSLAGAHRSIIPDSS